MDNAFHDPREVTVTAGDLQKILAVLAVGSFNPKFFGDTGFVLNLIAEKLEEVENAEDKSKSSD